ncbi:MAG: hypothetical protein KDA72_16220 [Planctomycetales bacterium]|nr:hypothetical protein [Planctomycetales bacterium]
MEDKAERRGSVLNGLPYVDKLKKEDLMTPSPHQTTGNHATMGNERPSQHHKQLSSGDGMGPVAAESGANTRNADQDKEAVTTPFSEAAAKLALELKQFSAIASKLRRDLVPAATFAERCTQAFEIANDLFSNAPTWVCFYRELMGGAGMLHDIFQEDEDFGAFLRTDEHRQLQGMLTALRSRDLPESDPNDSQRMITVRLPKSLHEAMCDEATRLNISVNRLCISRMLQLLDPAMIPETNSKPRGRKPRTRSKSAAASTAAAATEAGPAPLPARCPETSSEFEYISTTSRP